MEASICSFDRDRLVDTDSSGRQALLSCGAVLDHFRVAMASMGWTANVEFYPNPNDHTRLTHIDFSPMSFVTDAHHPRPTQYEPAVPSTAR